MSCREIQVNYAAIGAKDVTFVERVEMHMHNMMHTDPPECEYMVRK